MKRNDYSNYSKGQEISGVTFQQHQNQVIESINSIMLSLGLDSSEATILFGLEDDGLGPGRNFSQGAIFINGEIFQVDSFSTETTLGEIYLNPVTIPIGAQVRFGDGILRAAHNDYKYEMSLTNTGAGLVLSSLKTLKESLVTLVGAEEVTNTAINQLINGASDNYDTLSKLETAIKRNEGNTLKVASNIPVGTRIDLFSTDVTSSGPGHMTAVSITPTYVTFNQESAKISPSDISVLPEKKRTIKLSCGFWFVRNGDNHVFEVSLLYRVGTTGSWDPVRTKQMLAQGTAMYSVISGYIELFATPPDTIEFGFKVQTIDNNSASAVNIGLGDSLEFDAIY